jgi:hypothetical protein
MKYEIKQDSSDKRDEFEIIELKIIQEKTRGRIALVTVFGWLAVVLITAAEAALTGRHEDVKSVLSIVTPLATAAFGWYLGKETGT